MPEECLKEMGPRAHTAISCALLLLNSLGNIICCENFSQLRRLLRVTAYAIRFVELCKSKLRGTNVGVKTEELTASEIVEAETL